jgi:O-succinylbenzoate synthase
MRIDSIELFHVALPFVKPRKSRGIVLEKLETVLARMACGETAGWGEASPGAAPLAGAEWAAGVFGCLRDWMAPALVGREIGSGAELQERLAAFEGNQFAKSALDAAWWDLSARRQQRTLSDVLGGKREAIELGLSFDEMDSIDEFLAEIKRAAADGFSRLELKFRPGWELQMLNFARQNLPVHTLHADCEGAMHLGHMETLCRMDDFNIAMVVQPLSPDDLVGHAMIQDTIRTAVGLDESITTVHRAEMALELKSCRYLCITPGRVGGLTPAVTIHDLSRDEHVPCWLGALPQTAIGTRTGLALAAKDNFTYPADYIPSEGLLEQDLAAGPELVLDEGVRKARLWSEPGIGVDPDPAVLDQCCIARANVVASG